MISGGMLLVIENLKIVNLLLMQLVVKLCIWVWQVLLVGGLYVCCFFVSNLLVVLNQFIVNFVFIGRLSIVFDVQLIISDL